MIQIYLVTYNHVYDRTVQPYTYQRRSVCCCISPADDDDHVEGSAVYRLQWFPESCSGGRTALGEAPLVAMSASTQVGLI